MHSLHFSVFYISSTYVHVLMIQNSGGQVYKNLTCSNPYCSESGTIPTAEQTCNGRVVRLGVVWSVSIMRGQHALTMVSDCVAV